MAHIDDKGTQRSNLKYIRTAMNEPMLERAREQELALRWKEKKDEKALHEMVQSYTRLVVAMATKFRHYGLPMGDLIQEGNIGLMQAAERFDPSRDVRFSTYAAWWIRSAIQDYVLRNWSIVRTGTTSAQKTLFFNLRRLRAKIEGKQQREGLGEKGRAAVAKELGVSIKDVEAMEGRLAASDQSLNTPIGENGEEEWQSLLADTRPNPEDVVIGMKDAETRSRWLREALGALTDRERSIIRQRHLNDGPVTLEDLGRQLGVSKERVRQLEAKAMEKMRISLNNHAHNFRELELAG
jgi:RNA polymerase sigma-32 factor